jgi:hypothetical protein
MTQRNYPDFYRPFEDMHPLSPEQLETSRQKFDKLFDSFVLDHMKDVDTIKLADDMPQEANLLKIIEVDSQPYSLWLRDKERQESNTENVFRKDEIFHREIAVQRKDSEGQGRERWSYRLCDDGIVRRYDGGDMWAKQEEKKKLGMQYFPTLRVHEKPDYVELSKARNSNIENSIQNTRLEADMGLNNQPVSPDEIAGLKAFIDSSTVLKK